MIDVHTHLWPTEVSPDYLKSYWNARGLFKQDTFLNARELILSMDSAGIEKSIVSSLCFSPNMTDDEIAAMNQYVIQQTQQFPDRLSAFCTLNPFSFHALDYLKQLIEKEGFQGLKLHPNMQQFYPDDKTLYPIYKQMEHYQKPILFHTGGIGIPPLRDSYGAPGLLDTVACDFPQLPIIMGHAGRIDYTQTATLLRKHPHMYADISTNFGRIKGKEWLPLLELLLRVKIWSGTTEKLLLGSDYPFYFQDQTIQLINHFISNYGTAYEPLSSEDIRSVMEDNAVQFCTQYHIF